MPGPAGQELKARRRRSAAFLLGSDKEAAKAPDGTAAAAAERRSGNQPHADAAKPVPVVQAESVPDRDPGGLQQLIEYIGFGTVDLDRYFSMPYDIFRIVGPEDPDSCGVAVCTL